MDVSVALTALGVIVAIAIGGWQIALVRKQAKGVKERRENEPTNTSNLTVVTTEREVISVYVVLLSTGERIKIEVPQDLLVSHLIPELLATLRVSQRLEDGRPVWFRLHSKDQGRTLDENLTIRQNGVVPLETLALHLQAVAG